MKIFNLSLALLFLALSFWRAYRDTPLLGPEMTTVEAASDKAEWEVTALCNPHSQIINPETVSFRFAPMSTQAGLQVNASLSVGNGSAMVADETRFEVPEKGWLASLFKGPKVRARYFCQEVSSSRDMHVSYSPLSDVKLLMAQSSPWTTMHELDVMGTTVDKSVIPLQKAGEGGEEYVAGDQTDNPYWFIFSMPVHGPGIFRTNLRYEVIN